MVMTDQAPCTTRERSGSSSRVHFNDNQVTPDHAGEIVVQFSPDKSHADAHIGFLQEGRKYEITINVPYYLGSDLHVAKANPHLHLMEVRNNSDKSGHQFILELEAYHDKLISEELTLTNNPNVGSDNGTFVLALLARVLGKGKGTPLLKQGIKCTAVDNLDSEMSDAGIPPQQRKFSGVARPKLPPNAS